MLKRFKKSKKSSQGSSSATSEPAAVKLPEVTVLVLDSYSRQWCDGASFPETVSLPVKRGSPTKASKKSKAKGKKESRSGKGSNSKRKQTTKDSNDDDDDDSDEKESSVESASAEDEGDAEDETQEFRVRVIQTRWEDMHVVVEFKRDMKGNALPPQATCHLAAHRDSNDLGKRDPMAMGAMISPDVVLVRQLVVGMPPYRKDYRVNLQSLLSAGIPAVNSLASCMRTLDRAEVYGQLWQLHMKLGSKFPVLPLSLFSNQAVMLFAPEPPCIVKLGSYEAGYGKIKVETQEQFRDVRSMLAVQPEFTTVERFVENRLYDIRVQVVGDKLRAYHRRSAVGSWKGNVGSCVLEEVSLDDHPQYVVWAEAVREMFGGLDLFTVDAIHCENGSEHILEINDSASGFAPDNLAADMKHCGDLVIRKLQLSR